MSLYTDPFYTDTFYGTDVDGDGPGGPSNLNAYQNVDGTVVLYWNMEPCPIAFDDFTWTAETDLAPTFDSVNFRSFSSVANPDFINADAHKGMVVPAYTRLQGEDRSMYWRVRGTRGGIDTPDTSSVFQIPEAIDQIVRQQMLDTLPDILFKKDFTEGDVHEQEIVFDGALFTGNTYDLDVDGVPITPVVFASDSNTTLAAIATAIQGEPGVGRAFVIDAGIGSDDDRIIVVRAAAKDVLVRLSGSIVTLGSVQAQTEIKLRNTSNLNRIYDALGKQMDLLNFEEILTNNDIFSASVRDSSIRDNFGFKLEIEQPAAMKTIDFREIIRSFLVEVGNSPSIGSIKRIVSSMYCVEPTVTLVRDTLDMFVDDPASTPPVEPFFVDDPSPVVDPATIWDDQNLAFGVIVDINNPLGLALDKNFVERIVRKLTPAHAPVYITGI